VTPCQSNFFYFPLYYLYLRKKEVTAQKLMATMAFDSVQVLPAYQRHQVMN